MAKDPRFLRQMVKVLWLDCMDSESGLCLLWVFIHPKVHNFMLLLIYECQQTWPQGYKKFFMLNSAEHENFSANKYENAN